MFGGKWGFRKRNNNNQKAKGLSKPKTEDCVTIVEPNTKSNFDSANNISFSSVTTSRSKQNASGLDLSSIAPSSLTASHMVDSDGSGSDEDDESFPVFLTMEETLNLGVLETLDRPIAVLDNNASLDHSSINSSFMFHDKTENTDDIVRALSEVGNREPTSAVSAANDKENSFVATPPRVGRSTERPLSESRNTIGASPSPFRGKSPSPSPFRAKSPSSSPFRTNSLSPSPFRANSPAPSPARNENLNHSTCNSVSVAENNQSRDELSFFLDEVLGDSPVPTPAKPEPKRSARKVDPTPKSEVASPVVSSSQKFWMNCLEENGVDLASSPVFSGNATKKDRAAGVRNNRAMSPRQTEKVSTANRLNLDGIDLPPAGTAETADMTSVGGESKLSYSPSSCSSSLNRFRSVESLSLAITRTMSSFDENEENIHNAYATLRQKAKTAPSEEDHSFPVSFGEFAQDGGDDAKNPQLPPDQQPSDDGSQDQEKDSASSGSHNNEPPEDLGGSGRDEDDKNNKPEQIEKVSDDEDGSSDEDEEEKDDLQLFLAESLELSASEKAAELVNDASTNANTDGNDSAIPSGESKAGGTQQKAFKNVMALWLDKKEENTTAHFMSPVKKKDAHSHMQTKKAPDVLGYKWAYEAWNKKGLLDPKALSKLTEEEPPASTREYDSASHSSDAKADLASDDEGVRKIFDFEGCDSEEPSINGRPSEDTDSPQRVNQSITDTKEGVHFDLVRSFDENEQLSPRGQKEIRAVPSSEDTLLPVESADTASLAPVESVDENGALSIELPHLLAQSTSEDTESPRKIAQSITDVKDAVRFDIVKSFDEHSPRRKKEDAVLNESEAENGGDSADLLNAESGPDAPFHQWVPEEKKDEASLRSKGTSTEMSDELPFMAVSWADTSTKQGSVDRDAASLEGWDKQDSSQPVLSNEASKSIAFLKGWETQEAQQEVVANGEAQRSSQSTMSKHHKVQKPVDSLSPVAETRNDDEGNRGDGVTADNAKKNVVPGSFDDEEHKNTLNSPLLTPDNPIPSFDFSGIDQNRKAQTDRKPSDRQSMPLPGAKSDSKAGETRRKSFANVMAMWRDKSNENPNTHFLSPDNKLEAAQSPVFRVFPSQNQKNGDPALEQQSNSDHFKIKRVHPVTDRVTAARKMVQSFDGGDAKQQNGTSSGGNERRDDSPAEFSEGAVSSIFRKPAEEADDRTAQIKRGGRSTMESDQAPSTKSNNTKPVVSREDVGDQQPDAMSRKLQAPVPMEFSPPNFKVNVAPKPVKQEAPKQESTHSGFQEVSRSTSAPRQRTEGVANKNLARFASAPRQRLEEPPVLQSKRNPDLFARAAREKRDESPPRPASAASRLICAPRQRPWIADAESSRHRDFTLDDQLQHPQRRVSSGGTRKRRSTALRERPVDRSARETVKAALSPPRSKSDYKSVVKTFLSQAEETHAIVPHQVAQKLEKGPVPTVNTEMAPRQPQALVPHEISVHDEKAEPTPSAQQTMNWINLYEGGDSESGASSTPVGGLQLDLFPSMKNDNDSYDAGDSVFSDDDEEDCECVQSIFSGNVELAEFFLPKMGMACSCGKKRSMRLSDPEEPTSLKNILRPWQVRFLSGFGITRGDQLVKAHHRSAQALASALRKYRHRHHMVAFKTKSCGMALQIWSRTAKTYVRSIRQQLISGTDKLKPPNTMEILSSFLEKMQEMNAPLATLSKHPDDIPKEGFREEI